MRSLLSLIALSMLATLSRACAPTDPGTTPRIPTPTSTSTTTTKKPTTTSTTTTTTTTTTTLPPCCKVNIIVETGNRALFNPALVSCPFIANFICSVIVDLQMQPTIITINDNNETIATGPEGMNSFAPLTCRETDKEWVTAAGMIVKTISCRSPNM